MNIESLEHFFKKLDRSFFVDNEYKLMADFDRPLPIGFGQTISQPSLVVEMTRMLALNKSLKVLEIGTGSGYQSAFLAEFAKEVYTVELIPELSLRAQQKLDALGYTNIHYKKSDGSFGWQENAPYDRIIATSAAGVLPQDLINQLATGGKMIAPIGPQGLQDLLLITKNNKGDVEIASMGKVTFVEMKGKYGWSKKFSE